jgi:hypothetical protein
MAARAQFEEIRRRALPPGLSMPGGPGGPDGPAGPHAAESQPGQSGTGQYL